MSGARNRRRGHPREPRPAAASEGPQRRHLQFAHAAPDPPGQWLVLVENDGTHVVTYRSVCGSFGRIERDGRWWRLNGVDRATGELVYLPEVEALPA